MQPGIRHLSCALIASLLLVGCTAAPRTSYEATAPVGQPYTTTPPNTQANRDAASPPPNIQNQRREAEQNSADNNAQRSENRRSNEVNENEDAFQPQIIYTAQLGLQVDRVPIVQDRAQRVIESHGGYIGQSSPGRMVLRVPADHFDAALNDLGALGEVIERIVQAQDESERIVDLESRLISAHALRDRLVTMIRLADDVEEALRIEQELARVVEQIELIQGRLRLATQQVAYATITLTLQRTPEEQRLTPGIPIAWVRDLGGVFNERTQINVSSPRRFGDGVTVDLPTGFIRYTQQNYVTQAVDANGVRIRVRRFENFDEGALRFWEQLVTRSLTDYAGLTIDSSVQVDVERSEHARLIRGQRQIAGETVRYMIAIGVSDDGDYVYAFEAWGVGQHFDTAELEIRQAISTMRCY